jgi:hypothetical protein
VGHGEPPGTGPYRTAERIPGAPERRASGRFSEPAPGGRAAAGRVLNPDEGIVIIESDSRGVRSGGPTGSALPPAASTRSPRGSAARRTPRARSASGAGAAKPAEPARPRALTSLVTKSMSETRSRPLEIAPLESLSVPTLSPLAKLGTAPRPEPAAAPEPPQAFTSASIRSVLATPGKLREIAILSELLQPPRALRALRRPR